MCNCSTALVTDSRSRETPAIRIYVRSPCIFLLHLIENKKKVLTDSYAGHRLVQGTESSGYRRLV